MRKPFLFTLPSFQFISSYSQLSTDSPRTSPKNFTMYNHINKLIQSTFSTNVIYGRWKIEKCIGAGATGSVYEAKDKLTKRKVAAKIGRDDKKSMQRENEHYQHILANSRPGTLLGIPQVLYFGSFRREKAIVMSLLGPSLEDILGKYGKFSLKSTLMIGIQLLDRLEMIHGFGIGHFDIKPCNLLMGLGNSSRTVHLVDFGSAHRFLNKESGSHIEENEKYPGNVGTSSFATNRACKGLTPSRRDDLLSLGYIMIYVFKGELPWSDIKDPWRADKVKESAKVDDLVSGMSTELLSYFHHVLRLEFDGEPHYSVLQALFHEALLSLNENLDMDFEWLASTTSGPET